MAENQADEILRVAVTFRRQSDDIGPVGYASRMTTEVVSSFKPTPEIRNQALTEFQQRGFSVSIEGPLTASVRGTRADFESLFGTQLSVMTMATDEGVRYSSDTVLFPADDAPWSPDTTIAGLIDDAYIQWPHIYMNQRFPDREPSPIPPFRTTFHHLRVPGDVAMMLNAARVHREGTTGRGVRVAMIDSGFAHGHAYFQEMGYNSSVVLAPGATDQDQDGNGHGTGESANVFAVAPDVTFIGVKLDNEQNPNQGASLLEGFQEALRHNPQIITVSLGFDLVTSNRRHLTSIPNSLRALEAEIEQAVADGIIVVFAAGNGHVAFPGMMPDVISAGGVFINETGEMRASDYASAFSSKPYPGRNVPDFCGLVGLAPNADYIMLPIPAGCETDRGNAQHDRTRMRDGWGVFSGTSAAAPQLAGACALLLQKNPGLTPNDVKSVLRRTCRDVSLGNAGAASNEGQAMLASPGTDGATGTGLVDVFAAWRQV